MPEARPFGRRQAPAVDPTDLSPAAEAFRTELERLQPDGDAFTAFQRARRMRVARLWGLRLLFCAPGVVCLAVGAPNWLSGILEALGVGVGMWIRGERRRQLNEIAAWEPET